MCRDDNIIDPKGCAEIAEMLRLQREEMEMAGGGTPGGTVVIVRHDMGDRLTSRLDRDPDGDFRANVSRRPKEET